MQGTCKNCGGITFKDRDICSRCSKGRQQDIQSVDDFGGRIFATLSEVAYLLGCTRHIVSDMISAGQIPVSTIGIRRPCVPVWWLRGVADGSIVIPDPTDHPLSAAKAWRDAKQEKIRSQVFDAYGDACVCCGSVDNLTIDHINGDGKEHRNTVPGGAMLYRWLIANDFPDGFQTLCNPCNSSKGRGARCVLDHEWHSSITGHRTG